MSGVQRVMLLCAWVEGLGAKLRGDTVGKVTFEIYCWTTMCSPGLIS